MPENPYPPADVKEPFLTRSEMFWAALIVLVPIAILLVINLFPEFFWLLLIGPPQD